MRLTRSTAILGILFHLPAAFAAECGTMSSPHHRVALLELYTSEGCDSCPPVDQWVSRLPARGLGPERVVVLGFHVDYWDRLGWPDPFAQRAFTERQQAASARNRARVVYTPQLLLNGKDFRAGYAHDDPGPPIAAANQRPPGASVEMALAATGADRLSVSGSAAMRDASGPAQAYLALYENRLTSRVMRGENRGRTLEHDFVVRALAGPFVVAPRGATALRHTFQLHPEWKRGDLHVAAFVQDAASGDVLQALDLATCS
jgi:hypothetical protein